jgi:carbamoyl-phosphate synthase small subunit
MKQIGYLLLEDGTELKGNWHGVKDPAIGELVFNTGMTGYQEILTDPSYDEQMVVMTFPLIGNTGINPNDFESARMHAAGLVVRELESEPSHYESGLSIEAYLESQGKSAISGVDTRALTKMIRSKGVMRCLLTPEKPTPQDLEQLAAYKTNFGRVDVVTRGARFFAGEKPFHLGVVDLGLKDGILKQLLRLELTITCFSPDATWDDVKAEGIDGLLLSNGPGDPVDAKVAIQLVKDARGKLPIWGICLGYQVIALAYGAKTYKMKFGHRGSNHPVRCMQTKKVKMSAQNHGYAVDRENLPVEIVITHENVNDSTLEGFTIPKDKITAVQFHPEEGPGPWDYHELFDTWLRGGVSDA